MELNRREGEHIRGHDTCLNRCIAGRTQKEWYENNKEYVIEKNKKWYENNKEHMKEYGKEWREKNKELIKEKKKEYSENNKEHIKKYKKEWGEKNKELIKEKKTEKFDCDCGGKYLHNNKARHLKTKKHIAFMNSHQ